MTKKVAVLFSGGLDSTYLIWKNLKDGNHVTPIYIEIENNEVKTIMEKNRIELLLNEFRKEFNNSDDYYNKKIDDIIYAIKVGVHANEGSLYFKQMPIWIFSIVFLQGMDNIDEIQIGYVSNDDAISYLDDIQNIYKSYQTISEPMKPLVFPLSKKKKYVMANELPKQYLELIFSCENARIVDKKSAVVDNSRFYSPEHYKDLIEYEPCCECEPCNHILGSNYYGMGRYPENYKKNLQLKHAYALHADGYKITDEDGVEFFQKTCSAEPRKEPYQLYIDFDNIEYETELKAANE